jgi:hypothetical protein
VKLEQRQRLLRVEVVVEQGEVPQGEELIAAQPVEIELAHRRVAVHPGFYASSGSPRAGLRSVVRDEGIGQFRNLKQHFGFGRRRVGSSRWDGRRRSWG